MSYGCLILSEFCVSSNLIGFVSDLLSDVLNISFSVKLIVIMSVMVVRSVTSYAVQIGFHLAEGANMIVISASLR